MGMKLGLCSKLEATPKPPAQEGQAGVVRAVGRAWSSPSTPLPLPETHFWSPGFAGLPKGLLGDWYPKAAPTRPSASREFWKV